MQDEYFFCYEVVLEVLQNLQAMDSYWLQYDSSLLLFPLDPKDHSAIALKRCQASTDKCYIKRFVRLLISKAFQNLA